MNDRAPEVHAGHDRRGRWPVKARGWKVFASDRSSPVQGTPPCWDGTLPAILPEVALDKSERDCGAGWNYCRELSDALRIGGLWPRTGRPSIVVLVEPLGDFVDRGDKSRAEALQLVRRATPDELSAGIRALSAPFAPHVDEMVGEQLAWREALARPRHDVAAVERGLKAALDRRGLAWSLRPFADAWAAWDARAAWGRRARRAGSPGALEVGDERSAWDAWDALTFHFAARQGWVTRDPDLLTVGVRDAYANGLLLALPTGPNELGYVVEVVT